MKKHIKKDSEADIIKAMAEKNVRPVLGVWVAEVFGPNPTREDYEGALNFVEDILKNAKKEPNYLKLLGNLAFRLDRSKFIEKLLPFIFRTVAPSGSKSKIYNVSGLEFDHKLIMEELKDTAEELQELKEKK